MVGGDWGDGGLHGGSLSAFCTAPDLGWTSKARSESAQPTGTPLQPTPLLQTLKDPRVPRRLPNHLAIAIHLLSVPPAFLHFLGKFQLSLACRPPCTVFYMGFQPPFAAGQRALHG
jgi:hypothetical protein